MSLKTLKDIECEVCADNGFSDIVCTSKDLKQEAIKWIKQDNLQELFLSGRTDILPSYRRMIGRGMKNWIKHFFNITEEELR